MPIKNFLQNSGYVLRLRIALSPLRLCSPSARSAQDDRGGSPACNWRPVVAICRGEHAHERNIRVLNRFWFTVDLLHIKRRFHAAVLGIVLTTNVLLPAPVLAQVLGEGGTGEASEGLE